MQRLQTPSDLISSEQDVQAYATPTGPGGFDHEMGHVAGIETASGLGEAL